MAVESSGNIITDLQLFRNMIIWRGFPYTKQQWGNLLHDSHNVMMYQHLNMSQVSTCLKYIKHIPNAFNMKLENDHVQIRVISSVLYGRVFSFHHKTLEGYIYINMVHNHIYIDNILGWETPPRMPFTTKMTVLRVGESQTTPSAGCHSRVRSILGVSHQGNHLFWLVVSTHLKNITLPETNIAPENRPPQ